MELILIVTNDQIIKSLFKIVSVTVKLKLYYSALVLTIVISKIFIAEILIVWKLLKIFTAQRNLKKRKKYKKTIDNIFVFLILKKPI